METVAVTTGEPWSDAPASVCPVIAGFCRAWNDGLPDGDRDRLLLPFLDRVPGTRADEAVEDRRALLAADWAVSVYAPTWLRAAGCAAEAELLESWLPIASLTACVAVIPVLARARQAALSSWDVACEDAIAAASASGGDAAWQAACAASRQVTAQLAGDVAWLAAGDIGWAAAWGAAGIVSPAEIASIVTDLQTSAAALVDRMIDADA